MLWGLCELGLFGEDRNCCSDEESARRGYFYVFELFTHSRVQSSVGSNRRKSKSKHCRSPFEFFRCQRPAAIKL